MVITNGAYPVPRPVSRVLRNATWFSFKLSVGVNGMLSDIFESDRLQFPRERMQAREYPVGSAGERFVMRFDATPYDNENMLKRLEFHSTSESIRRLLYAVPMVATG